MFEPHHKDTVDSANFSSRRLASLQEIFEGHRPRENLIDAARRFGEYVQATVPLKFHSEINEFADGNDLLPIEKQQTFLYCSLECNFRSAPHGGVLIDFAELSPDEHPQVLTLPLPYRGEPYQPLAQAIVIKASPDHDLELSFEDGGWRVCVNKKLLSNRDNDLPPKYWNGPEFRVWATCCNGFDTVVVLCRNDYRQKKAITYHLPRHPSIEPPQA